MALPSSTLRRFLRWQAKRAIQRLKKEGINPHIPPKDVNLSEKSATDTKTGEVGIFFPTPATIRHELTHRAHILRSGAPTPRLRRQRAGKYMENTAEFAAISEMLAALSESDWGTILELDRRTKQTLEYLAAHGTAPYAYARTARNEIMETWHALRKQGTPRSEARRRILEALLEAKNLRELQENTGVLKRYGSVEYMGVREMLAAERLGMASARRKWKTEH